jgi:uncharacterized protein
MTILLRAVLPAVAAALALATPASAASPDVVVSQVYGGGGNSGATFTNDFIELYNRGTAPVPLAGWSVQYGSATGTTFQSTALAGTIGPSRHYLVQEAAGAGGTQDLPAPNATGSIAMSATSGKVRVVTDTGDVRDLVGYGTANQFETAPTPALSNTTAALRNGDGAVDTDNNAADFTVAAPNPRNTPGVTATDPADGAADVPLDANITVTFGGPVEPTFGTTCSVSGAHEFTVTGEYTLDPAVDFARGETCTVTVRTEDLDTQFRFTTVPLEGLRIHDIQGAQHRSPYEDRVVGGVPGVVTAASGNGIWVQDPQPDADDRSSEGVFLFQPTARPPVGTAVVFSGAVQEFKASGWGTESLSLTEISRPTVTAGNPVTPIAPTVIGAGGRVPPNQVIDNDSTGDVDTNPIFDPQQDGIDFHESLEGMLVQFDEAVASGPTNGFGEVSIVGPGAGPRTPRGGVIVRPNDFKPERLSSMT